MPEPVDIRRRVVTVVVALVAALFMALVTIAALPPTSVSDEAAPATRRLSPFFAQDWQLFAPNPLDADRLLLFQAAYRDGSRTRRTAWLDWSDVELDLVRRHVVGGRGGYVSNKMWAFAVNAVTEVGPTGRDVVTSPSTVDDPPRPEATRSRLDRAGVPDRPARRLAAYDDAVTTLATQALRARHPDLDLVAVRWRLASRPVVPYDQRFAAPDGAAARRAVTVAVPGGWRRPAARDAAADLAVRDFERRHR